MASALLLPRNGFWTRNDSSVSVKGEKKEGFKLYQQQYSGESYPADITTDELAPPPCFAKHCDKRISRV